MERVIFITHPKRAIFVHSDGIHQILGLIEGQPPVMLAGEGAVIEVRGQTIPFASLYRVTTRGAYYKSPTIPQSYNTFHEAQQ